MMQAQIIHVWQGLDLETGEATAKVSLRLPGGLVVEQNVPPEYMQTLLDAYAAKEEADAPSVKEDVPQHISNALAPRKAAYTFPEDPVEGDEGDVEEEETPEEETSPMDEEVNWGLLPEAVLPNSMKYAFKDAGLPDKLPAHQVLQIRDAFFNEYTEADWQRIVDKYSAPEEPEQPAPPKQRPDKAKPAGKAKRQNVQVDWSEGSVMRPAIPSKTVPKDSLGYPVLQKSARGPDPTEAITSADDEDGVEDF